nr:MAG: protein of unknown function DUF2116 [Bacteriophage sp.]
MALIKCPECGKEISDKASNCPNCGCPLNEKENLQDTNKKTKVSKRVFIGAGIIVIIGVIVTLLCVLGKNKVINREITVNDLTTEELCALNIINGFTDDTNINVSSINFEECNVVKFDLETIKDVNKGAYDTIKNREYPFDAKYVSSMMFSYDTKDNKHVNVTKYYGYVFKDGSGNCDKAETKLGKFDLGCYSVLYIPYTPLEKVKVDTERIKPFIGVDIKNTQKVLKERLNK